MNINEQIKQRAENLKCGGKKKPIPAHAAGKKVMPMKKKEVNMKKKC